MAKLRTYKAINNDVYTINFVVDADALSTSDKNLMNKFGEPEINVGGTFIGGAIGTAVLSSGSVASITIVSGGNSYPSAPAVTFSSGSAAGTAVLTNGAVTSVTITNGGSGYGSTPPTVTFTAPANQFILPDEYVKIRSGFPIQKEFDSTAPPFDTNTLVKVNAYKDHIQTLWTAAITNLRTQVDSFTGEEIDEV